MIITAKRLGRLAAAWLILAATAAQSEPLSLDRLLKLEDLGSTALSPDGRRLVIETQAPFDQAARFDFDTPDARIGRLMVADLATGESARPLFAAEPGAGYRAGPFSPSGRQIVVSRWKAGRWDAGIADLESGAVRWLPFGVDQPAYGRSLQWVSETAFVAIALEPGELPVDQKLNSQNRERLPALWARQAEGRIASASVMGSGRARLPEPRQDRRLLRFDLATGTQTVLATGGFFDLELSPSRRYLAVLGEAERVGLADVPAVRMMAPSRRRALTIVDLRTGAVQTPCPRCTTLIEPLVWAPGADRLLVFQHPVNKPEATGALTVIDPSREAVQKVGAALIPDFDYGSEGVARVRADWLGPRPIALGKVAGASRGDWYDVGRDKPINLTSALPSRPDSIAIVGHAAMLALAQGRVWRIGVSGRATQTDLRASAWLRPSAVAAGIRQRSAVLRAKSPWLLTDSGIGDLAGHLVRLPPDAKPLAVTRLGAVFESRAPSGVATIGIVEQGRQRALITVNADLAKLDQGVVRVIESRAANGQMLKSWVLLPPAWRPGQKPPLIVVPYPGSAPQTFPYRFTLRTNNLTPSAPLLAAQGYAVLVPALPRDRSRGEPGEGLADEILAVVDAVLAQGLADPDRLALWGHSFGGYAALVTATHTHRFKAIIAQAAPSDFVANWASTDPYMLTASDGGGPTPNQMGFNETGQGGLKGPPWRDPERYRRNSPLFQADRVTTPIMLIHGDQDYVALAQGQAMFNALYRQNKDATLLTLFGERHLPASPANLRAIYAEVLPWLADRLEAPSTPAAAEGDRPSQ
ncbi:prolyl oligopeptidase family serine peptidase [Caulobacter rhizosphaerae]|jgi:dipeptidyl aminopeptidase/acylaminoacyl peptidase|uniref:prolyl oligopeptidase family serine peptidase n=1 Tax=Caulobacter rhizosphaerae TaxID=2010972 RepID=UPI0013D08932|nr:prolyl oligopeptidase family serine peptidase [Caulobacter rhizosphaerae]GGL18052.1 S9 family peptidase [Caulobacter rhizosphaerae]